MRTSFLVIGVALCSLSRTTLADFQVVNAPQMKALPPVTGPSPTVDSSHHDSIVTSKPLPSPELHRRPFLTARGFGNHIPLVFAVQQIVPPAVKVRYGPGVDRTAFVTWQGDRPWDAVLGDAVKPLGLRLHMQKMMVTIEN